jgi:hypothetical protein
MVDRLDLAPGDRVLAIETEQGILLTPHTEDLDAELAATPGRQAIPLGPPRARAVSGPEPRWLGRLAIDAAQFRAIRDHGGAHGIRDENALGRQ